MKRSKFYVGKQNTRQADTSLSASMSRALDASLADIIDNIHEFIAHMEGVSPDILVEVLEPTFGKSIEYCPKKTGALVDSAYLEPESYRGGARVEMGYGRGGNPDYAILVHELPYAHENPTRSKFLESALDEDYFSIISSLPRIVREYAGT